MTKKAGWDPRFGPHPVSQYTAEYIQPTGLPGRPPGTPMGGNTPATEAPPVPMHLSRFRDVAIPQFFQAVNAPAVAQATNVPLRVHIRNIGPVVLFFSEIQNDLNNPEGPTGAIVRIPVGERDVFVLAPEEYLYALAAGPGGIASIATSDAFGTD